MAGSSDSDTQDGLKGEVSDGFRPAVDLRPVNAVTIKEALPMPHLDSEINDFSGSKRFTSLEFVSGF